MPQIELVMIGPTRQVEARRRVRELATELHVDDHLVVRDAVPKASVAAWLDRADIFLNTTHVDNTPVSVMEAMACGLCVVSTNVGGIPYLVRDGEDALLVEPDNPRDMASAVRRVVESPGLGERLSRSARQSVSGLDWSHILPRWEAILCEAVSASSVRRAGRR
jgi:glycosyltransferase involved in cell wall biosynthesis